MLSCLLALLALSACHQSFDDHESTEDGEKLYVTFTVSSTQSRETRAVPNAPSGTEADADYESSYKTVDVLFFEQNGNIAQVGQKKVHHFESAGFAPSGADKDNWVDGVYERSGNKRGVYLAGVTRGQVTGKTCVVVLNLPAEVRTLLERGTLNTLAKLKDHVIHQQTSADEQLGPIPYPLDANNQPDYNSSAFRHIVMIGEKSNIAFSDNDVSSVIQVQMVRTIAKVKIVGYFSSGTFSQLPLLGYSKITMTYQYKNFPSETTLGAVWKAKSTNSGTLKAPKDGLYVESPAKLYGTAKQPYFVQYLYMNEYGELPDNVEKQPTIEFSALFEHHTISGASLPKRYWVLSLPRGMERNKSYTIYVKLPTNGETDPGGSQLLILKADKVVVKPWDEGTENFFTSPDYIFNNFSGSPTDPNDHI